MCEVRIVLSVSSRRVYISADLVHNALVSCFPPITSSSSCADLSVIKPVPRRMRLGLFKPGQA